MENGEKKFVIKKPAKTFRILGSTPGNQSEAPARKRFVIRSEGTPVQNQEWFRQNNSSDCGPCLILNSLRKIKGAYHIPQSIDEVRQEVNKFRREKNQVELQPDGWFTNTDIQEYLTRVAGLDVKQYAAFADQAEEVSNNIRTNLEGAPFEMIYGTVGRHFRGIVPSETGYELLDSFNSDPQAVDTDRVNSLISESIAQSTPARTEVIGIVRTKSSE